MNLLFLNLPGVLWLLARDGLPAAFILFLIYTVYTLFLEMGDRQDRYSSEIEHFPISRVKRSTFTLHSLHREPKTMKN